MPQELKFILIFAFGGMIAMIFAQIIWENGYNSGKNEILEKYVVCIHKDKIGEKK